MHAKRAAIAGINALNLARHQPIGNIGNAGAAIAIQRGTQETHFAEFIHDLAVEALMPIGFQDARHQAFLAELPGAVANHALFFRQHFFKQQRVFPGEGRDGGLLRRAHDIHASILNSSFVLGDLLDIGRTAGKTGTRQAASTSGASSTAAGAAARRGRGMGISMKAGT